MPSLGEKLNDFLIPAALGAMIYFLQAMAHDSNELAKNVAVMARRQDDNERRIELLEAEKRAPGPRPR